MKVTFKWEKNKDSKKNKFVTLVLVQVLICTSQVYAYEKERDSQIERELACITQRMHAQETLNWDNLCSTQDYDTDESLEDSYLDSTGYITSDDTSIPYDEIFSKENIAVITPDGVVTSNTVSTPSKKKNTKKNLAKTKSTKNPFFSKLKKKKPERKKLISTEVEEKESFLQKMLPKSLKKNNSELMEMAKIKANQKKKKKDESRAFTDPDMTFDERVELFREENAKAKNIFETPVMQELGHDFDEEIQAKNKRFWYALSPKNPKVTYEVGTQYSRIEYEQPDFFEEKGFMAGISGSYTYRHNHKAYSKDFGGDFARSIQTSFYRIEAMLTAGEVDYDRHTSNDIGLDLPMDGIGSADDIKDYMVEVRGTAGIDIPISENVKITPFTGLGYRYLNDDFGEKKFTNTNQLTYERESTFFYMPIGFDIETKFFKKWVINTVLEYDLFLGGTQKSNIDGTSQSITGTTTLDPSVRTYPLEGLENNQDDGFGLRGSMRFTKESDNFDIYIEPFVKYWEIDQSDPEQIGSSGDIKWFSGGTPINFVEPENKSTEYGVKVGAKF